jgi:hypothetical protein
MISVEFHLYETSYKRKQKSSNTFYSVGTFYFSLLKGITLMYFFVMPQSLGFLGQAPWFQSA